MNIGEYSCSYADHGDIGMHDGVIVVSQYGLDHVIDRHTDLSRYPDKTKFACEDDIFAVFDANPFLEQTKDLEYRAEVSLHDTIYNLTCHKIADNSFALVSAYPLRP